MSLPLKSQQELYTLFITALQDQAPLLTDTLPGSDIDILAGVFAIAGMELQRQTIVSFNKTFLDLANGPEITLGTDDLQTLAVDRYGAAFGRPGAVQAIDTITFTRPGGSPSLYGAVTILAGSIVKTQPDANGNAQRYATDSDVTLTNNSSGSDLTISVGVKAVVAGAAGDAVAGAISAIETSLLDPTILCTNAGNQTGQDAQDDATYRETIRNLISSLRAATKEAVESSAKSVAGVVIATAIEIEQPVLAWNPATNLPVLPAVAGLYEFFYIPFVTLYVADSGGSASPTLIAAVVVAIDPIRAYGVYIDVVGATPVTVDWSLQITLNPSGPNYLTFLDDASEIVATMSHYIATLGIATSFVRATAEAYILSVWGPAGTNDLTAVHTTTPTGDVSIGAGQTAIPGTVKTV